MSRTSRFLSSAACLCLPAFALALALALALPRPAAAQEVQITVTPQAPVTGDLISVALFEEPFCVIEPQRVERFDGGLRIWVEKVAELPPGGPPGPQYRCRFIVEATSAAFLVESPGAQRVEVLDLQGALVLQETVTVSGPDLADDEVLRVVETPSGSGNVVQVRAEGVWGHTGVPVLDSVELGDAVIHLYFRGRGNGGSAVSAWRREALLGPLQPGFYSIVSHTLRFEQQLSEASVAEVTWVAVPEVPPPCLPSGNLTWGLQPDPTLLCLRQGRFQVRAFFTPPGGTEQPARPRGLAPDSGAFWFFQPNNLELMVKVLDGCAAFDRYWVFVAGLTNVGVRLEVTDTRTGATWSHATAPGEGFGEVRDTDAFDTCP